MNKLNFDDRKVFISEMDWNDLVQTKNPANFFTVSCAIKGVVEGGGSFLIDGGPKGILQSVESAPAYKQLVDGVNDTRRDMGLDPVKT